MSIVQTRKKRGVFRALFWSGGTGTLLLGALLFAVALNLYTYERLTDEVLVADIFIDETGPYSYIMELTIVGKDTVQLVINGDEWQLDARFLRWTSWAAILGKDPMFRLERVSGRYSEIKRARVARYSVYALSPEQGLDIWKYARQFESWLPFIDAYFGSSVYMPLEPKARYRVTATSSGLMVRPANEPASKRLQQW